MIAFLDDGASKVASGELIGKIAFKMVMEPVPQLVSPILVREVSPASAMGYLLEHHYDGDKPNVIEDSFAGSAIFSRHMIVCTCDTIDEANELLDVSFRNVQEHSEFSTEKWQTLREMDGLEITPGPNP